MARIYNLIERLRNRNERPMVVLDEDHKFKINTSKTNVLCIMAYVKKREKNNGNNAGDDPENDIKLTDKVIEMALGKEAYEYIESQNYTLAVIQDIIEVIMAAIGDEEASFEKDAEDTSPKK